MNRTKIEWTDYTWSPVTGCRNACSYCYARKIATRFKGTKAFPNGFEPTLHPDRLEEPLRLKKPSRIFVCSMGELFQPEVPTTFVDDILEVMQTASQHTYLVLTKQPHRIDEMLYDVTEDNPCRELGGGDFLPNLWIGVSVEKQSLAEWRMPPLLKSWPGHKFVSCEPLHEKMDLSRWLGSDHQGLEWVIVGAETPRREGLSFALRQAVGDVVMQCEAAGVPVFMKNNLGYLPEGPLRQEWPRGG